MNSTDDPPVSGKARAVEVFAVLARWFLGGMFLYLGLSKALHPVEFLKLVRQYDLLQHHLLLNFVASTLPWFEIFCGLLLLLGVAVRGAAVMLVAMLVPFTWSVLLRALDIHAAGNLPFCAIKFDCGCGAGEVLICRKLAENVALTALSTALIFWRSHRLCLRPVLV
jgi:uncharacterized membrane protein YphA (DoxX/SURF4 family)